MCADWLELGVTWSWIIVTWGALPTLVWKRGQARCLRNTEIRAMQRKQGWKLDGSGFWKKNKKNSRDNYLCVIITLSPKQGKKLMGKLNEKKTKNTKILLPVSKARSNARWRGRSLAFKTRWRMCFSGFRTSRSPSFVDVGHLILFECASLSWAFLLLHLFFFSFSFPMIFFSCFGLRVMITHK